MIKRLAVLAIFLGATEAVNLRAYNQLIKEAGQAVPPELAEKQTEKTVEATQAEAEAKAASTAEVAKAATTAATAAAANADPILTVNTVKNAPEVFREKVILDPKILQENAAVKAAVEAAKVRVSAEPKIKAQRDKYNALLPDPLAPDQPLNPLITEFRRARTAADVPSRDLGNPDVKSVAGPAETDQIGKSVYDSAMKGCDETPGPRNILSKKDPSFTPGALPPIPWPAEKVEGAPAAPAAENKEVVVVKQRNPDANPTKLDVAVAVAKADRDMKEALTPTSKDDPLNDPALAVEKAVKVVATKSEVAGAQEMAKAEIKVEAEAKQEMKKAREEEKQITAEKEKAAAEEERAEAARKAEDVAKADAEKAQKKAEEAKAEAEAAKKHVEEVKKDKDNAEADAKIEKKAALEDKEAAKDLSPQQVEAKELAEKKEKAEEKIEEAKEKKNDQAKSGEPVKAAADEPKKNDAGEKTASSKSIQEALAKPEGAAKKE